MAKNKDCIAVYSRKSKFTGKGESIGNQVELSREYIRTHYGDAYAESMVVYEDEGFSGGNLDRPDFKRMMKAAHEHKFKAIVVYRLDRISPPYDSVSLSHKGAQVFFHILILNALYHLAFPTVEDEFPCDGAIAVLCLGAFFLVHQMTILLWLLCRPDVIERIKLSAVARTPAALPYNVM